MRTKYSQPLTAQKKDGSVTVPVEASFEGATYGLGTLLAAGWKGWFGTIPIVITWADMDDTTTDGVVTTISPRVGRLFGLGRAGIWVFLLGFST